MSAPQPNHPNDSPRPPDVPAALVELYQSDLLRFIRRALAPSLHHKVSPEDVLQRLWISLLASHRRVVLLSDPQALCPFLFTAARNEVANVLREFHTGKRECARDVPLDAPEVCPERNFVDPAPDPAHLAAFNDLRRALLARATRQQRQVLELLLDGYRKSQVATRLGMSAVTVRRIVKRLAHRFRALQS